jgi:hypothetical protein
MLIWANEFKTRPERRKRIVDAICRQLDADNVKYRVHWNNSRC